MLMKKKVLMAVLLGCVLLSGCQGAKDDNQVVSSYVGDTQETVGEGTTENSQTVVIDEPEFTHKDTIPIEVVLSSSDYRLTSDGSAILIYDKNDNMVLSGSIKDVYEDEDVTDLDSFIETLNSDDFSSSSSVVDRCTVNGKDCLIWEYSGTVMYELVVDKDKQLVMSGLLELPEKGIKGLFDCLSINVAE